MEPRNTTEIAYPTGEEFCTALDAYVQDLPDEFEDETENDRLEDRAESAMYSCFEDRTLE